MASPSCKRECQLGLGGPCDLAKLVARIVSRLPVEICQRRPVRCLGQFELAIRHIDDVRKLLQNAESELSDLLNPVTASEAVSAVVRNIHGSPLSSYEHST